MFNLQQAHIEVMVWYSNKFAIARNEWHRHEAEPHRAAVYAENAITRCQAAGLNPETVLSNEMDFLSTYNALEKAKASA